MAAKALAGMVCSLLVMGCGGGGGGGSDGGGNDGGGKSCADVFATPVNYTGMEVVVGCYFPGTYSIQATISQTTGTCSALFNWKSTTGSPHSCTATLSGDATHGYKVDFSTCSLPGTIQVPSDLSTFTGSFNWTAGCGSGTTTFESMAKQ